MFADIFRYQLLKNKHNIIYVDCDVYCLKPLHIPKNQHLFGYECPNSINVAILALPTDSLLLDALIGISNTPNFVPEWYSPYNKLRLSIKRIFGFAKNISEMGWGVIGPSAITYYAKKLNISHLAQPKEVLYPINYEETAKLSDPNVSLKQITTCDSVCIHLYNEKLRSVDFDTISTHCILSKILNNEL